MALTISHKREDKYAFLFAGDFSGSIDNNKDVENLYGTLTQYYNYKPSNIRVVYGGTIPPVAGAVQALTNTALQTEILNFITLAKTGIGASPTLKGIVLFYFTGLGVQVPPVSGKLLISGAEYLLPLELQDLININLNSTTDYYVHLIMQQDYGLAFKNDIILNHAGADIYPCAAANAGGALGSNFTAAFCNALRFYKNASGFADEIITGEGSPEPFHISLAQACVFAGGAIGTNYFGRPDNTIPYYLGTPSFLVRDGSPWWESPDIFLTHPTTPIDIAAEITAAGHNPDDYYAFAQTIPAGNYNYVNVNTRNFGTHPVRFFQTGIKLYESGVAGGEPVYIKGNDLVDESAVQKILIPIPDPSAAFPPAPGGDLLNVVTTTWSTTDPVDFPHTTHRCIRAKVNLSVVTSELDDWTKLLDAEVLNEAQRNIDVEILSKRTTEYQIYNPFQHKANYVLPVPEALLKHQDELKWVFLESRKEQAWNKSEMHDLKGVSYFHFDLGPKEKIKIRIELTTVKEFDAKNEIRIPFEFLISMKGFKAQKPRKHAFHVFHDWISAGGFTLVVKGGHSALAGIVQDVNGKGVAGASVTIQSPEGFMRETCNTDEKGFFSFKSVPNGIYAMQATAGNRKSRFLDVFVSPKNAGRKIILLIH